MPTIRVGRADARKTLTELLRRARLGLSWSVARQLVKERRVRVDGQPCLDDRRRLRPGQHVEVERRAGGVSPRVKPTGGSRPRLAKSEGVEVRFADEQIVVVEKPAGLTTMRHPEEAAEFGDRARRFLPDTLADLLPALLSKGKGGRPPRVIAVHRLDNETSGLVVFARTPEAAKHLGRQFRGHMTDRAYLAVTRGRVKSGTIESWIVRDRGDGRRGSGPTPGEGQRAVTHVRVVEEFGAHTLVECRLETGRTHQVRIHLAEAGAPLCGERVYDRPLHGKAPPDNSGLKRVALHAVRLGFVHPVTGATVCWTSELPEDMRALLERLRSTPASGEPGA